MTYVGLLTEQQAIDITDQLYMPDSYFHPIQDKNDNWVISQEEMDQCENIDFMWVKDLTLIVYEAKIPDGPF